ncbi:hypothetical protein BHK98_10640 [Hornefia porci]|uniref:Uncharacterized protein n=1 Tax=Hornefia porci TaxID=2652292 RepID=A0A1Q9JK16_9FIRM|nr:hypothetical protein BHK98_10640 [Hornefia porci]
MENVIGDGLRRGYRKSGQQTKRPCEITDRQPPGEGRVNRPREIADRQALRPGQVNRAPEAGDPGFASIYIM